MKFKILIILVFFILIFTILEAYNSNEIYLIEIDGVIGPPVANYVVNNLEKAEEDNVHAVLLEINTPGGLDPSMRKIITKIMNSPILVIGYVTPEGAHAASAGAFIMMACDIAAMTPTSNIGAAHPVTLGAKMDSTMQKKVLNDMISYMTSIVQKRDRNEEVAKKMITESISLTAKEAFEQNIIEYVVKSRTELLAKINNIEIEKNDKKIVLQTENIEVIPLKMSLLERFFYHISNPNIAYILLMLGIYGIIAEFSSPGIGFAGVFGTIALLLAFFALSNLPINLVGILLIVAGVILILLEIRVQSSGILGIGGVVGIILGSLMLIQTSAPFLKISISLIIGVGVFTILFFFLLASLVYQVHRKKITTGRKGIIGEKGYAITTLKPEGTVFVRGELWQAESIEGSIKKDEKIEVVKIDNLKLIIKKLEGRED
ncbi:MAG: nodulation protein NfeD [Candidatus Cloacimonetes bacterium]|nr:nodulation protein NfeD [Candidatus Cloacimonadota bacterium]